MKLKKFFTVLINRIVITYLCRQPFTRHTTLASSHKKLGRVYSESLSKKLAMELNIFSMISEEIKGQRQSG